LGGVIALQLGLQTPEAVQSLALLEPALMVGKSAAPYRESLLKGQQRYRAAGASVAVDEFLEARWPGYSSRLDVDVAGAFDQAVHDAETTFEVELPGWLDWHFGEDEAKSIETPVLAVVGEQSLRLWDRFAETQEFLLANLPMAKPHIVPGATHFLQLQNQADVAGALGQFWSALPS
jgi:pimeloyl-ACP methyl ester carboxylesterase